MYLSHPASAPSSLSQQVQKNIYYAYCNFKSLLSYKEPRWRSRYRDWLWAERLKGRSSSLGRVKNFRFSKSSRPALRSTQPPIQWVAGALSPGVKRPTEDAGH
jgi:hypothetical protein